MMGLDAGRHLLLRLVRRRFGEVVAAVKAARGDHCAGAV